MVCRTNSSGRKSNDSFGTDELRLLALACCTFMDVPNSLKPLHDVQTRNCVPFQMDIFGCFFFIQQAMRREFDQTDTDSFLRLVCVCPVFHHD